MNQDKPVPEMDLATAARREQRHRIRMDDAWGMLSGILSAGQMAPERQLAAAHSLPLTVLAGFLGAGKTTLLNRLLAGDHGKRLVVLVNDFGRINIDASLISAQTEDTISLSNGCVCCSLATDLSQKLIDLAQRTDPPDAVVLEASGLADPHGIVQVALSNPAYRLDGVVTLVDAESMRDRASDALSAEIFGAQLAASDLIVLNKLDLLDAQSAQSAQAWIAAKAPGRPIVPASHADVPAEIALGVHRDPGKSENSALGEKHARGFASWSIRCEGHLDREKLCAMLREMPASILRAKGVLCLSDDSEVRTIYQRVGTRWELTRSGPWEGGDSPRGSSIVFIGPVGALDNVKVRERLEACTAG